MCCFKIKSGSDYISSVLAVVLGAGQVVCNEQLYDIRRLDAQKHLNKDLVDTCGRFITMHLL